jgi:hypothetical protein
LEFTAGEIQKHPDCRRCYDRVIYILPVFRSIETVPASRSLQPQGVRSGELGRGDDRPGGAPVPAQPSARRRLRPRQRGKRHLAIVERALCALRRRFEAAAREPQAGLAKLMAIDCAYFDFSREQPHSFDACSRFLAQDRSLALLEAALSERA